MTLAPLAVAAALFALDPLPPLPEEASWETRLAISPAILPTPRLRYELLPPPTEHTPGNAAVGYLRAVSLLPRAAIEPERQQRIDNLREWPVELVPVGELNDHLRPRTAAMGEADRAARLSRCEWDGPPPGPATLSLAVAPLREVAAALSLRVRVELAERRFDAAVRTLQTLVRYGKHTAEAPTLLQYLVGLAITSVGVGQAEQWVGLADAPSLYAALATLPRPLLDPRPMLDGEAAYLLNTYPQLRGLTGPTLSADEANRLYTAMTRKIDDDAAEVRRVLGGGTQLFSPDRDWGQEPWLVRSLGWDYQITLHHKAAMELLAARGRPASEVAAFPPAQAVCLSAWTRYEDHRQEFVAAFLLPTGEGVQAMTVAHARLNAAARANTSDRLFRLLAESLNSYRNIFNAQVRLERRVALLRAVEALRLHLATSGGRLPDTLAGVTVVPVPDDPATGKPFEYRRTADGAELWFPPFDGKSPSTVNAWKYVLAVRK